MNSCTDDISVVECVWNMNNRSDNNYNGNFLHNDDYLPFLKCTLWKLNQAIMFNNYVDVPGSDYTW